MLLNSFIYQQHIINKLKLHDRYKSISTIDANRLKSLLSLPPSDFSRSFDKKIPPPLSHRKFCAFDHNRLQNKIGCCKATATFYMFCFSFIPALKATGWLVCFHPDMSLGRRSLHKRGGGGERLGEGSDWEVDETGMIYIVIKVSRVNGNILWRNKAATLQALSCSF